MITLNLKLRKEVEICEEMETSTCLIVDTVEIRKKQVLLGRVL